MTHVERVKAAVSDVRKTLTETERRVYDVTNSVPRLVAKHDDTERKMKHVSGNTVQQIDKLEKRQKEPKTPH